MPFPNNSAPCSHCVFLKRGFGKDALTCQHPDKENKRCKQELGTTKGWNTVEYQNYIELLHGKYVENNN